ncbi:MAG: undecaprenyldiphospho-muramoylpentapeptide beta-N-acetylglucosaminyltransferase [Rhodospirillales bacterium]
MSEAAPTIALAAGGTGGHIFPAEALARALLARGCRVALLTDRRGQGFSAMPEVEVLHLSGSAVLGRSLLRKALALTGLLRGAWQARGPLKRLGASAVVGFGGFASVPAVLAGRSLGLPTLLHEQNAVIGRANRLLVGGARLVATAFPEVRGLRQADRSKLRQVGNPVRDGVARLRETSYPNPEPGGPLNLLVTGGSQGAKAFDSLVPDALALLPEALRRRLNLVQQVRSAESERLAARYADLGIEATLAPFFKDLPERLATAQLLIGRSGASTLFELAMAGRPGLLIPYPYAADDHQQANAEAFAAAGGGWLLREAGLEAGHLAAALQALFEAPERLVEAAAKARAFAAPDAAERLADLTLALAGGQETGS